MAKMFKAEVIICRYCVHWDSDAGEDKERDYCYIQDTRTDWWNFCSEAENRQGDCPYVAVPVFRNEGKVWVKN